MVKLQDYKRVIGIFQLLYLAGKGLKRQGIKYTTLAGLAGVLVIVANLIGKKIGNYDPAISSLNAALLPTLVALLTFGLGNTLTGISNLFSSEKILIADANSMNLMEDRKKADIEYHLAVLWERVFKYESRLHNHGNGLEEARKIKDHREQLRDAIAAWPDQTKSHFAIDKENMDEFIIHVAQFRPFSSGMEATKEGFIVSAGFALKRSLPQKLQKALTGLDFSLIEDWYDGAFFTANDCKLKEQFAANQTIRGIRKKVGIPLPKRLKEALSGCPDPLWHSLTMKKVGMSIGVLIDKMNKQYVRRSDPYYFDAQDFLWNETQTDNLILTHFAENQQEILKELRAARKNIVREVFSHSKKEAHNQIYRMFGIDYLNALDLRLDYDIEFGAGLLDYDPVDDITELAKEMLCPIYPPEKVKKKTARAKENLKAMDDFLDKNIPTILQQPLKLRAARIGYHLNRFKIQKMVRQDPQKAADIINNYITGAHGRYSQRICLLRQHYELCRIQLFSYAKMVDSLGEYD